VDRRLLTDGVIAFYLLATAALAIAFREALPQWKAAAGAHLFGASLLLSLRFLHGRLPAGVMFLRDWYPVMLFPILYQEVEWLAAAFGNWGLTERLQELEASLFGGQPSVYLSERLASVPLSEYLHFCYFSYLLLVPLVGGLWYFKGKREAFHELILLVSLTYAVSYLFYILLPVDSPFYLTEPLPPPLSGQFFYELVHFVSERGGARGGAFPSSHVSVSTVILLVALRHEKRFLFWLLPLCAGVALATVYGRFHYAVDVLAGWILALGVVLAVRMSTPTFARSR
jgi:membrane-associated phospholipid phosphatase